ncbi:MAG: polysaccharide deacetylase family protein, partial [Acidimicrobiia bacterium]
MGVIRQAAQVAFAIADSLRARLPGPRILIYHQVGSGRSHEMNLPVEVFARQLDWLLAHREIVTLEQAVDRRTDPDADRLFVLTFDDGYADVFQNAFPLLAARRVPFTLYLTTGPIDRPEDFADWPGLPLSWDQIREMHASGLATIGAHTHTHPDFRFVDESEATEQIERSNRLIEQHLGMVPRHFTYPKGWWSEKADPVVRAAYATATVGMGPAVTADADLHQLGRIPVMHSDPFWA